MKRWILALALAALLALAAAAACAEASTTLLVYLCGADLQEAGCIDMYEMAEAETGSDTNIVVLAGGAEKWDDEDLTAGTRNLVTIRGGYFTDVTDFGRASMGDPDSLLEFLKYGLTKYPAERTIVVLWNHGLGSEGGMCVDVTANEDALTLNEINDALYQLDDDLPDYHIDVFGCDACMMATYEMASLLSHYNIDYFVASEEVEPGIGWFYTPWLKALEADPGLSNEALCGLIVDSYMEDCATYAPDDPYALSAVRLDAIPALAQSMETFSGVMTNAIRGGELASVRRGRSRIYTFGSFCDGSWDMVDMQAALDAYAGFDSECAARASACLRDAVVSNRYSDSLENCCGLSMLIPQDTCGEYETYRDGCDISYYLPNHVEFVNAYVDLLNGSNYSFTAQTPTQMDSGATVSGVSASVWNFDWDSLFQSSESITVSESDQGFTMHLSKADLENLDYVEGMLMMDVSDDEMLGYVDLGLSRDNRIDWQTGDVYSLFDGRWSVFGNQLVPLYDQTVTQNNRRSLIPVKLNGEYTYLVVVFPSGSDVGRVIGANAGYGESGLPIRETKKLQEGDSIVPVFTLYYQAADADADADLEQEEFDGDEILWRDGMTVTYESFVDADDPMPMQFCFVLNDIFGDYDLSEPIEFKM